MSQQTIVYRGLFGIVTLVLVLSAVFPVYWLALLAVTPQRELLSMGILLPPAVTLEALSFVLFQTHVPRYIVNSLLIAVGTTVFVLLVGSSAAYAFGRLDFWGKHPLLFGILLLSFFPPAAIFVPLYQVFNQNVTVLSFTPPELYNTGVGIGLPISGLMLPLAIFILVVFFNNVPDDLEDAARVEGATRLGAIRHVILPLAGPGVATAGALIFLQVYNEFFFSFLMTDGQEGNWGTIIWGYQLIPSTSYETLAAATSLIALAPVVFVLLLADRHIFEWMDTLQLDS